MNKNTNKKLQTPISGRITYQADRLNDWYTKQSVMLMMNYHPSLFHHPKIIGASYLVRHVLSIFHYSFDIRMKRATNHSQSIWEKLDKTPSTNIQIQSKNSSQSYYTSEFLTLSFEIHNLLNDTQTSLNKTYPLRHLGLEIKKKLKSIYSKIIESITFDHSTVSISFPKPLLVEMFAWNQELRPHPPLTTKN